MPHFWKLPFMLNVNKMPKTSKTCKNLSSKKTLWNKYIEFYFTFISEISQIFFSFLRPKSGYFPNEILEFSSLWRCCTDCLKWSACKKKENSSRDLLMHHLSSHFLKVVFCALKLFAVLADFPIVRLISFAWAFILNLFFCGCTS